jgi:hypothetical protein
MKSIADTVEAIRSAKSWDRRIGLIRRVPEDFGTARQAEVFARVARDVYAHQLTPDFAFVHWHDDYELAPFARAYAEAAERTYGFERVSAADIESTIATAPGTLRVFRVIVGLTTREFAAASESVAHELGLEELTHSRVESIESGRRPRGADARVCAEAIDRMMSGRLFPPPSPPLRSKLEKPDTHERWASVRRYAADGVPYEVLLHQRLYGGAFRQLLDATSGRRGDQLEEIVRDLLDHHGIGYVRTGGGNQHEIAARFGLTVRPAPDFVVFDGRDSLRAMIECKWANDGGTARDKASRFRSLREEARRLGGVPVFAVLAGLGWARTSDALGPVVRDTDGRVFLPATIASLVEADPFPRLRREA